MQKDSLLPIPGAWGKMEHTHIRLVASEDVLTGALRTAWKLRMDENAKTSRKNHVAEPDLATLEGSDPQEPGASCDLKVNADPGKHLKTAILRARSARRQAAD